jgi:hypothetical protein
MPYDPSGSNRNKEEELAFDLQAITNEPLALGMRNLIWS